MPFTYGILLLRAGRTREEGHVKGEVTAGYTFVATSFKHPGKRRAALAMTHVLAIPCLLLPSFWTGVRRRPWTSIGASIMPHMSTT